MCRYLWNAHVAAVACDSLAVESFPSNRTPDAVQFGFMHQTLIGNFGMALGELWWLKDLVDDCRQDGVYEMFLASSPLNSPGGIGSPANVMVIK
jgi:kynurenine formamidase